MDYRKAQADSQSAPLHTMRNTSPREAQMNVKIIRTDGTEEQHEVSKGFAFAKIQKLIGASCCDTVNLRDGNVMLVDDNGYETKCIDHGNGCFELKPTRARKPINAKATELYLALCIPGTDHRIAGDVEIVRDADFA